MASSTVEGQNLGGVRVERQLYRRWGTNSKSPLEVPLALLHSAASRGQYVSFTGGAPGGMEERWGRDTFF